MESIGYIKPQQKGLCITHEWVHRKLAIRHVSLKGSLKTPMCASYLSETHMLLQADVDSDCFADWNRKQSQLSNYRLIGLLFWLPAPSPPLPSLPSETRLVARYKQNVPVLREERFQGVSLLATHTANAFYFYFFKLIGICQK